MSRGCVQEKAGFADRAQYCGFVASADRRGVVPAPLPEPLPDWPVQADAPRQAAIMMRDNQRRPRMSPPEMASHHHNANPESI
jgi:hypothetical protein